MCTAFVTRKVGITYIKCKAVFCQYENGKTISGHLQPFTLSQESTIRVFVTRKVGIIYIKCKAVYCQYENSTNIYFVYRGGTTVSGLKHVHGLCNL
jgi:hypothetical protein